MEQTHEIDLSALMPLMQEQLHAGKAVQFVAYGRSMLPLLHDSVVTLVSPPPVLKAGDVPLYRRKSGQYVLHRVVGVNSDGSYRLCGDNQYDIESPILHAQVVAVLTAFERDGKVVSVEEPWVKRYVRRLPLRRIWLHYRGMTPKRAFAALKRRLRPASSQKL